MPELTLDYILENTRWVARCNGWRYVDTYDKVKAYADREEDCKEIDTVCAEGQPKELIEFYKAYEAYGDKHGFMTIQDYYNNVWAKGDR